MASASLTGQLLVSTPGLSDPRFARSVVLVLSHSPEGALGVVLNRPGGLRIGEVLPRWDHLAAPPDAVFIGGPVQPDTALCLGGTASNWWPVDVNEDPDTSGVERVRLFAAYSGWSPGQLEAELAAGGWYQVDATANDIFTSSPEQLWRSVLRRGPGRVAWASTAPQDPRDN